MTENNNEDVRERTVEEWLAYIGEPRIEYSRRFLEQEKPYVRGYYVDRHRVYDQLRSEYHPWDYEYEIYSILVRFWFDKLQTYDADRAAAIEIKKCWYFYRQRHPLNETVEQMSQRLFPSLYLTVLDDDSIITQPELDDVSIITQPDYELDFDVWIKNYMFIYFIIIKE